MEKTVGGLLSVLFVMSCLANFTLIYIIVKHKKLRTVNNYLNVCFALINLYGTLTELPLMIVNNFNWSFVFGREACIYMGFTLFSYLSIAMYTLTMISIERYLVICQPFKTFTFNVKKCLISMSLILVVSLLFATIPLVGWSEYTIIYGKFTCWVSEDASRADRLSFLFFITFLFSVCLFLLIYTNLKSILAVSS